MALRFSARFVAAAAAATVACGGGPGPSPVLEFTLTASPTPIVGAPCTGCGTASTDRESATTVTIQETGGATGTVLSIALTLRDAANATIAQGQFDGNAVVQLAGSNRLPPRGTLAVRCGVHYPASEQGRAGTLTMTVRIADDRGNTITHDLAVPVAAT